MIQLSYLCNGDIRKMVRIVYQEMEYLKHIKENSHLLSKLHLAELDNIDIIASEARECLLILKEIKSFTRYSSVFVENLKPVIQNLKSLEKKIYQSSLNLLASDYIFDLLTNICKSSQHLINNQKFMYDVNTGIFGVSDHMSRGNFDFEKMYYFSEKNFEDLILNIYLLISRFESEGEPHSKKKVKTSNLIQDIQDLIGIVEYLSDKNLPFTLFIRIPKAFKKCIKIGDKIESHLLLIVVARKLRNYTELIENALVGLKELAKKYKNKPNKKISLDALVFNKDGANELGEILRKAEPMFRLL